MRMLGHAIHDGAEYVPAELLAQWEQRDPVRRFREHLLRTGADPEALEGIDRTAEQEIAAAVAEAEAASLPDAATVELGVYAP